MMPADDLAAARQIAALTGIAHFLIEETTIDAPVAANPPDRCYHCKKVEFARIAQLAANHGIQTVLDGTNLDDESDYRPGMRALAELHIASPFREAGLAKADIRALSRHFGLPTWDKPAAACLASRVPYGEPITLEKLRRIDRAEHVLRAHGFRQCRVRHHGDVARIEVAVAELPRFLEPTLRERIVRNVRETGYRYVALDLQGYRTGSLNEGLK